MATIVTRITGATAKGSPLTSAELDQNFINLNDGKLETSWTGSTNLSTLGTVTTGTWNATTIATTKGGTGLTSFTSGGAVYATSTSALTTGTLPVTAGGTGVTTSTGSGSVVLSTSPTLVTPILGVASATSLTTSGDIIVGGNITVNGTTTTINSTTISVDDKNIELGSVTTPTNTTADGGGITLKGTTDKTFNWVNATGAWTSSEHIDLASGKNIYLRGATSGTVVLAVPSAAGTTTITFPATTGTVVTTGDTGTVTNTMLAGSIANAKLANSNITIGTTAISLGASSLTLAGLTSVTSTTFIGALTGNATTATTLATSRNINGVAFNGSADITITAAAGTLTGTTLNSTVVSSSLTSVGNISTGTWNATNIALNKGGTNASLTATSGGIVYSTASAMGITSAGTTDQFLKSNGSSAPTWTTIASVSDDTSTDSLFYPLFTSITSGIAQNINVSSTNFYYNPSTGTLNSIVYNSLSDVSQKTNIQTIQHGLSTIESINAVEYDWKQTGKKSSGVIAQELEMILPHLVCTNDDGLKSVNYNGLVAYLIEAMKELSNKVKELENR